ncbi:cytochrome P450 [Actinosynnema sp. NPDC059335]|uniref:cytochrome P450 n=1 Tax=Actinosynnema sp. NPDC059335 TaxID=3346804 RepID=UPI003670506C
MARFDHSAPGVGEVIHDRTAELRERCPVARSDAHGGFHVVTRARDIRQVATDDATFSSAVEGLGATMALPTPEGVSAPLFDSDRPEHTRWRRVMRPFFSRDAAARHEPYIRSVARGVLADLRPRGEADLVADFAAVVPPLVTAALLGVPGDRREEFSALARELFTSTPAGSAHRPAGLLLELIRARRGEAEHRPARGAVDHARVRDHDVDDDALLKHAVMMVAAATLTTADTIANTALVLGTRPELRQRVLADPALIPALVEESVRHESAVAATGRTVRRATALAGVPLRRGDRVLLLWGSGNRDADLFPDGDVFRLDRPRPDRHLGWGAGPHRCLGVHLARLQLRVVVQELLAALPDFEPVPGYRAERTFGALRGLRALPVRWSVTAG